MCNLYSITKSADAMRQLFRVGHNRGPSEIEPLPAIFPGWNAPIVRLAEDGERELLAMSWGFVLPQPGRAPRRVTNVRDDKVLDSRFWRPSFDRRRCLVPVTAFCEPDDGKPARWHWFSLKSDEDPRPLFALAGIWQRWQGPVKKDGEPVDIATYAFMMTPANAVTASINHDRCPVMLRSEDEFQTWLTGTPAEAYSLVRTPDPDIMHIVQSGMDKEDLLGAGPQISLSL